MWVLRNHPRICGHEILRNVGTHTFYDKDGTITTTTTAKRKSKVVCFYYLDFDCDAVVLHNICCAALLLHYQLSQLAISEQYQRLLHDDNMQVRRLNDEWR